MKSKAEQSGRVLNKTKIESNQTNLKDQMLDKLANMNPNSTSDYHLLVQVVSNYIKSLEPKPLQLSKAEKLLVSWINLNKQEHKPVQEKIIKLLLLTINSWAAYYQSKLNLSTALSYLTKYQDLVRNTKTRTPGLCRLIASTLYSASSISIEINQFKTALSYAQESLQYLRDRQNISDSLSLFIGCHYNSAVCYINLGRKTDAEEAFTIVFKSRKNLPSGHYFIPVIKLAYKKYKQGEITPLLLKPQGDNGCSFEMKSYSSNKQLVKAKQFIDNEHKTTFIDTDKYFYNKISSMMKLSDDVKNISATPMIINGSNREEKKSLDQLRNRKFNHKPSANYTPRDLSRIRNCDIKASKSITTLREYVPRKQKSAKKKNTQSRNSGNLSKGQRNFLAENSAKKQNMHKLRKKELNSDNFNTPDLQHTNPKHKITGSHFRSNRRSVTEIPNKSRIS